MFRLCLIEDDLLLGRALKSALEDEGHRVLWLRMAADARVHLGIGAGKRTELSDDSDITESEFDAIVLDLNLPDGDGRMLLTQLRRTGSRLPVVIVTARDTLDERLDGLDAGADDYLVKPFDSAELMARLRAVMRRGQRIEDQDDALFAKDIRLNEQNVTVTVSGKRVSLSPTEFALLRELLAHKNRVRTRRQLESEAMPESEGQSLDVHISNLRRKVGAESIRTVRGVGYVLDDD